MKDMRMPQELQKIVGRSLSMARAYCGGEPNRFRSIKSLMFVIVGDLSVAAGFPEEVLEAQYKAMSRRPPTDVYFMNIAQVVATRATCDRKHVGAVIVRDRRIIATGYNGSPPGLPHCDDVGHDLVITNGKENCVRTVHAEMNAVAQAALYGVSIKDADIYTNTYPCWNCAKALLSGGVKTVYVDKDYNNDARVEEAFKGRIRRVG